MNKMLTVNSKGSSLGRRALCRLADFPDALTKNLKAAGCVSFRAQELAEPPGAVALTVVGNEFPQLVDRIGKLVGASISSLPFLAQQLG